MPRIWRWILWPLGILLVLLVVAAAGIDFYSRTPQFRSLLRAKILAAANAALNGELQFKEITGSIWGDLEFRDVAIIQNGERVIAAPRVIIDVGLPGQLYTFLNSSTIRISRIEIIEPQLALTQDTDKRWNLSKLAKDKDQEPGRLTIELDNINLKSGRIRARTADGKQAQATGVNGIAEVNLLPSTIKANLEKLAFTITAPGMPATNWTTALSLTQAKKHSSLELKQLNVATAQSRGSLTGTINDLAAPKLDLKLDLIKVSAGELKKYLPASPLREDISGRLQLSGPLSKLAMTGTVTAHDGRVDGSTTASLTGAEVRLQGNLELKEFKIEKVLAVTGIMGNVNGRVNFAGASLKEAVASVRGRVTDLTLQGWKLGQLALSAQLQNSTLALTARSEEKNGSAELKGTLTLSDTPAYEGTLRTRALDLSRIAARGTNLPAAKISLDAWIRGQGTDPKTMQADGRLTIYASQVGAVAIDRGRAEGSIRDGTIVVRRARLSADGSTLNASGRIASATRAPEGQIRYVFNSKEIRPWLKLAGVEGSGGLRIDGFAGGSLQAPRLDGKARLSRFQIAGARLETGNLDWRLTGSAGKDWQGRIDFAAKHVNAGVALSAVEAHIDLAGIRPATLDAEIVARDAQHRVQRIKGRVVRADERTDIRLQELSFQLPDGTWHNPRPAHLMLTGKRITVEDFMLRRGAQSIAVTGNGGLEGTQDLSVQVNGFSLGDVRAYISGWPEVTGNLSLTLQVNGTAAEPLIDATVGVDKLVVAGQPYAGLAATSAYRERNMKLDLRLLQDQSHSLKVDGTVPVDIGWAGNRSMAITGDTNLRIHSDGLSPRFLGVLSKDITNLQGSLTMDILLRGPLLALQPRGTIQFQNGAANVRPLGLALKQIGAQAELSPGAIQITRFSLRSGQGELDGSGRFALQGTAITNIAASLKARDFQVSGTREYKADASGTLSVSGTLQQPRVGGNLTVKATLHPNLALTKKTGLVAQDPTIRVVRSEAELAPAQPNAEDTDSSNGVPAQNVPQPSPLYERLTVEITTMIARGTWIYLDEGSIETTGQLKIRKAPREKLAVSGQLQGLHGSYTFQGRRFDITQAQLVFTGGSQIDPRLDVTGRYKVAQYQIDLVVGGYLSKPTLTLRSEPPLDQAEILSVLLFGKPTTELSQGEKNVLQKQALAATANFVAADLKQAVAQKLGIDTLQFGVGDNLAGGQIEAGKYVTSDIFVSTKQQFGGEKQQEYSLEYNLTPNWRIKSSTTPRGNSGIDLFWHKQY